jgi:glycosyltransferase involved in cell wall biosynthesis
MKNILMLHPKLLFYKIRIYNLLSIELEKRGYRLHVWSSDVSVSKEPILFCEIHERMDVKRFIAIIRELKIDIVINILSGVALIYFYLASTFIAKCFGIKLVYYGHGLDLRSLNNMPKYFIHNFKHFFFDRILLYSANEINYLWKIHHNKVYVAHNTLALSKYNDISNLNKKLLKSKYQIRHNKLVLFCGRIETRKKLDVLLNMFRDKGRELPDSGLVIIGDGLSEKHQELITGAENIYYMGPIYDENVIGEVFHMCDVFCIPGHMGLGLVEAMYWSKPVLTLNGNHAPEICYLKNGYNGYLIKNESGLFPVLKEVLTNADLLDILSKGARKTYLEEATIERMFQGFYDVLDSFDSSATMASSRSLFVSPKRK